MFKLIFKSLYLIILLNSSVYCQSLLDISFQDKASSIKEHLKYESDSVKKFIVYRGFVVFYGKDSKIPFYTYHHLTYQQVSPGEKKIKRRNNFFVDDVNLGKFSATNQDYKYSGYDRGHMVPAGDFNNSQLLKDETFVYSNICPQNPVLNRGIWSGLENSIRNKILNSHKDAYIVTGIIPNSYIKYIGQNKIAVPMYIFKLIYFPDDNLMYAFLVDNSVNSYENGIVNYQVSVNSIEKITKEDFYDLLEDKKEEVLESQITPFSE